MMSKLSYRWFVFPVTLFVSACATNSPPSATSEPTSGTAQSSAPQSSASTCPPAKKTDAMCAAVMTYVKIDGQCCAYPSPCAAADGAQFGDDKCSQPMK